MATDSELLLDFLILKKLLPWIDLLLLLLLLLLVHLLRIRRLMILLALLLFEVL